MVHQSSTSSASPYRNGFTSGNIPEPAEDQFYLIRMHEILSAFSVRAPPYPPCQISNHLYMGSLRNAEDTASLRQLGVTHVLNVAGTRKFDLRKSPYAEETGITNYLMIPAEDHEDYDMMKHFSASFDFIDSARKAGGCAFVHCNLGVNRSGCIAAGYLMYDQRMHLLEAIEHIKAKRLFVLFNKSFRHQLVRYARIKGLLDHVKESTMQEVLARASMDGTDSKIQPGKKSGRRYIRRHNSDTVVVLSSFKADRESKEESKVDKIDTEVKKNGYSNHVVSKRPERHPYPDIDYQDAFPESHKVDVDDIDLKDHAVPYNFCYSGGIAYNKAGGSNLYPTIATPGRRRRYISRREKQELEDEAENYMENGHGSHTLEPSRSYGSSLESSRNYASAMDLSGSYGSLNRKPSAISTNKGDYSWLKDRSYEEKTHDRHYPSTSSSYSSYKPSTYSNKPEISSSYSGSLTRYSTPSLTQFTPRKHYEPPSSYSRYESTPSYKPVPSGVATAAPFVSKTWSGYAATRNYDHSRASSVISHLPKSQLTRIGSYHQTVLAHHSPSTRLSSQTSQYRSPLL